MRVAIVGTGVSGLVCAHLLHGRHDVVVFEADERVGGHTHTHRVELPDATVNVDTGFLVYNERTYPLFCRLLDRLGVATQPSDMSFSVADERTGLEWRGTSLSTVFAQRRNLARPEFLRMLADVARFNRLARQLLDNPPSEDVTLADVLASRRWSDGFLDWYLVPLGSSIWSADQPAWRTVTGGAQRYVDAIVAPLDIEGRIRVATPIDKIRRLPDGVEVVGPDGPEHFDHVIVATHSDQALRMLSDPTRAEIEVLGAIRYQPNQATLHTDTRLLPRHRRAWASWNYHRLAADHDRATLTYHLNPLQSIPSATPLLVTLNRDDAIDPSRVLARMDYSHPVLDPQAISAQRRRGELHTRGRTWFCGAYWGYGFHEDGVRSAVEVCAELRLSL